MVSRWWTSLNDPGLDRAMEVAFRDNLTLAAAWDRLRQAEAIARGQGALRGPSLDANGSASRTRERIAGETSYSSSLLAELAVSYEVDVWGRLRAAHEASRYDVEASEQDVQAAALSVSATVATVWVEIAEASEQIRILEEQVDTNEQILELVTEQFRQGKTQAADVLRQRQLVQSTEGLLIAASARRDTLQHQLAVLLGRSPKADWGLDEPRLPALSGLPETGLPSELMKRRPDVKSAYLAVQAQDRRLAAAVADRYPRIGLSAEWGTRTSKAKDLFDDWFASLAGNLTGPLFDAGARKAEVNRNRARLQELLHQYGLTVLTALQEVEDALSAEAHQMDLLNNLHQQLETSSQVVERTRSSYVNGQLDYLRVLDAISSKQSLLRQRLTAERELVEFRIQLHRALAGPIPLERPEHNEAS